MNAAHRALDVSDFSSQGLILKGEVGAKPKLLFLPISSLVIDPVYQREVGVQGRKNIRKIANEFRWSRFEPVIVAPIASGFFAIINGQHRAMGARLRGLSEVPCAIVEADPIEQAAAFAAINGNITAITSMQLHHAAVAAGDKNAVGLDRACGSAGVKICRYPIPASNMKVGDTLAATALAQCFRQYAAPTLGLALRCITQTGEGNVGLIRAQLVKALCIAIAAAPKALKSPKRTIKAVEELNVAELWAACGTIAAEKKRKLTEFIASTITAHFEDALA